MTWYIFILLIIAWLLLIRAAIYIGDEIYGLIKQKGWGKDMSAEETFHLWMQIAIGIFAIGSFIIVYVIPYIIKKRKGGEKSYD